MKEKQWSFSARVYLPPEYAGAPTQPAVELEFVTPVKVYYREVIMLCIEIVREVIEEHPDYTDYEWTLSIIPEQLTTVRQGR